MKFSIIIPTYNRARDLADTLRSLAGVRTAHQWEVVVADNNSRDATRSVVAEIAPQFPVEVHYVLEREQGRSAAMNAGMARASGDVFAFTDDDVRVQPTWLDVVARGLREFDCDYVGGKILPLWGAPQPRWLSTRSARHRAVIAIADYGSEPFELGANPVVGCNLAVRREAFASTGLWDNHVGRRGTTLLGQEVREWCVRARQAGLRGCYLPDMVVHHLVQPKRLSKQYFRRWFYWHGVSRAILHQEFGRDDMESPEDVLPEGVIVRRIAGVPRYLIRRALGHSFACIRAHAQGNVADGFDHELWLWFFAGIVRQLSMRPEQP